MSVKCVYCSPELQLGPVETGTAENTEAGTTIHKLQSQPHTLPRGIKPETWRQAPLGSEGYNFLSASRLSRVVHESP